MLLFAIPRRIGRETFWRTIRRTISGQAMGQGAGHPIEVHQALHRFNDFE
jgi:hypothetical protein